MSYHGITSYNSTTKEQNFLCIEKVKSFSQNYLVSCALKTLGASIALSFVGFPFSTTAPICFTVIVCRDVINFCAGLKNFALQSVKASINTLAEKCTNCLREVAEVVTCIFKEIAGLKNFALQSVKASINTLAGKCTNCLREVAEVVTCIFKEIFEFIPLFSPINFCTGDIDLWGFNRQIRQMQTKIATMEEGSHNEEKHLISLVADTIGENIDITSHSTQEAPEVSEFDFEVVPLLTPDIEAPLIEDDKLASYVMEEAPEVREDSEATSVVNKNFSIKSPVFTQLKEAFCNNSIGNLLQNTPLPREHNLKGLTSLSKNPIQLWHPIASIQFSSFNKLPVYTIPSGNYQPPKALKYFKPAPVKFSPYWVSGVKLLTAAKNCVKI